MSLGRDVLSALNIAVTITKRSSITFSQKFSMTGYKTMKNRDLLIDSIHTVYDNPTYRPQLDRESGVMTTYCNQAVSDIATRMGCKDFVGLTANDICDFMSASTNWSETPLEKSQQLANQGSLVVAGLKDSPHGHVCLICPGIEKSSGHWNAQAPAAMNIGKTVFISKGLNYAFIDVPKIYVWRMSL